MAKLLRTLISPPQQPLTAITPSRGDRVSQVHHLSMMNIEESYTEQG